MSDKNDIRIDVVGNADGFKSTPAEVERELDRMKAAAASAANGLRGGAAAGELLTAAAGALATGAATAVGGLAAWATAQVAATFAIKDTADEVGKLAQRMGESVTSVSELRHVFNMAGASTEQMAGLMKSLEVKAQDAAKGTGQAAAAYKAMGIAVADTNGDLKGGRELLEEVAERIAGYRDGAAKAALVQDALGGSWVKMIPLLNGGADGLREAAKEAHALGVVFDEKLTQQSAELNDNLTRIKTAAEGAKIALGSELLPTVRNLTEEFVQGIRAAGGFWAALSMGATLNPMNTHLENIKEVRADLAKMEADQKAYGYLDEQRWNRKQAQLKYLLAMQADIDRRGFAALSDGLPADDPRPMAPTPPGKPLRVKKTKADDSAHREYLASLKDEAKAELDLMAARQKAGELLSVYAREDALTVQRIARSAELALMSERERGAAEAVYQAEDKSARRQEQIIKQIADEATRTQALAEEKALLAEQIDRVRDASLASFDTQRTFAFGWEKAFQRYQDAAGNAAQKAEDVFKTATDGMADALTNFAMTGKLSFSSLANDVVRQIIRMQMQAASSGVVNLLGGAVKGFFSSQSSAQAAVGADINSAGLGGYHAGGIVGREPSFIRYHTGGIAGDEVPAILKRGEGVFTEGQMKAMGGAAPVINMTVINQGAADGYQAQSSVRENNGKLDVEVLFVKAMQNDLKRNGPMTQGIGQAFGLNRSAA